MGFELTVKSNTPLIGEEDKQIIARMFLESIGYITKGSDPEIPLSLFMDCFMSQPDKPWLAEEMTSEENIPLKSRWEWSEGCPYRGKMNAPIMVTVQKVSDTSVMVSTDEGLIWQFTIAGFRKVMIRDPIG